MQSVARGFAVACGVVFASLGAAQPPTTHEVVAPKGKNAWTYKGKSSPSATVGKPDGRLVIRVKNGDLVAFKVEGGRHGVVFENAVAEMAGNVWEVVPPGDKGKLQKADLGKAFYSQKAQVTDPIGPGTIITIKINNLKKGPENAILFGCNPHSESDDGKNVMMLGAIVLDDG